VVLAFIDWDHQILPDAITLPGILVGLPGSLLPGSLIDWREAGLAAGLGYLAFFLVARGYARLRGIEGLGQGDWKLAAMMGSFLGGQRLMLAVFLASFSGMIYGLVQATRLRHESEGLAVASPPAEGLPGAAPDPTPPSGAGPVDVPGGGPGIDVPVGSVDPASLAPPLESEADGVSIGKYKLPFGTFLAASAIFVLFWGDPVLMWYASFFRF